MKVEAEIDLYASMLQQILKSALQKTTAKKNFICNSLVLLSSLG